MKRMWMILASLVVLPALLLTLAATPDSAERAQQPEQQDDVAQQDENAVTVVAIEEVDGSDVIGIAVVREMDGKTIAVVSVVPVGDAGEIENIGEVAVHEGTCDEPGDEVANFGMPEALELGYMDRSIYNVAGTVEATLEDVVEGEHILVVFADNGEENGEPQFLACGDFSIAEELDVDGLQQPEAGDVGEPGTSPTPAPATP